MISQINKQQYSVNLEVSSLESWAEMIMSDSQLLIIKEKLKIICVDRAQHVS